MVTCNCPNCGRRSGFKRHLGWGTFFMVVLTCGFWLLAIPFYPSRCINCGISQSEAFGMELAPALRRAGHLQMSNAPISPVLVAVFIGALILLLVFLSSR